MPDEEKEDNNNEEVSNEHVKKILREALEVRLVERKRKKMSRNQLTTALTDTLGEFLTCYRIFGFDVDGKPVTIAKSHNNMEKSAMENLFVQEFGNFMSQKVEL